MKSNVIIERYGNAFVEAMTDSEKIKELADIIVVKEAFLKSPDIYEYLSDPVIGKEEKKKNIKEILKNADDVIVNFFNLIIDNDRTSEIEYILDYLHEKYYELNNIEKVHVTSAKEINADLLKKLEKKLEKRTGKKIELIICVDNSIIGGLIVKIADVVIDMSIKKQLADVFS